MSDETKDTGLALLRKPFPPNQISQLPKGTKAQNSCPANEKKNCNICGGWHHPQIIHLTYVGHAALTDRLLDADPLWTWEPLALKDGLPAFDESGGLWIKLTVCGHTRIGYGHAVASEYKEIGSREKEVIGDALRNAAMRFGAALDLWHKGDLHLDDEGDPAYIDEKQLGSIVDMILARWPEEVREKNEAIFLNHMKAESADKILAKDFQKAVEALKPMKVKK